MFFRIVALIVVVFLIFYALFIFLKNFGPKEEKPVEQPKPSNPTSNDDPEAFLKKVEIDIELMHVAIQECEAKLKAGILGEEARLENLKNSLTRIEKLKEEYIKNK